MRLLGDEAPSLPCEVFSDSAVSTAPVMTNSTALAVSTEEVQPGEALSGDNYAVLGWDGLTSDQRRGAAHAPELCHRIATLLNGGLQPNQPHYHYEVSYRLMALEASDGYQHRLDIYLINERDSSLVTRAVVGETHYYSAERSESMLARLHHILQWFSQHATRYPTSRGILFQSRHQSIGEYIRDLNPRSRRHAARISRLLNGVTWAAGSLPYGLAAKTELVAALVEGKNSNTRSTLGMHLVLDDDFDRMINPLGEEYSRPTLS